MNYVDPTGHCGEDARSALDGTCDQAASGLSGGNTRLSTASNGSAAGVGKTVVIVVAQNSVKPAASAALTALGMSATETYTVSGAGGTFGPAFRMEAARKAPTLLNKIASAVLGGVADGTSGAISEGVSEVVSIATQRTIGRVLGTLGGNFAGGVVADAIFPETAGEVCSRDGCVYPNDLWLTQQATQQMIYDAQIDFSHLNADLKYRVMVEEL